MICVGQAAYGVDQALGNNTLVTRRLYVVTARRERRLCPGLDYPGGCKHFLEVYDRTALIARPRGTLHLLLRTLLFAVFVWELNCA